MVLARLARSFSVQLTNNDVARVCHSHNQDLPLLLHAAARRSRIMNHQRPAISSHTSEVGRPSDACLRANCDRASKPELAESFGVPSATATFCLVIALLFTLLALSGESGSAVARHAAWGSGIGFSILMMIELRDGWRQVFRADIIMLIGIYFLTLFEFFFEQPKFDTLVTPLATRNAVLACFVGYIGIALGRHWALAPSRQIINLLYRPAPRHLTVQILLIAFLGGFFYMFLCVSFNPITFIHVIMASRFNQPWARGQFGDWKALLYETSMLIYLVPPLCGIILARRSRFSTWHVIFAVVAILFTLFYAFATGTRNVFGTHVITGLAAYVFALESKRKWEPLFVFSGAGILLLSAFAAMLEFRDMGLTNYGERIPTPKEQRDSALYVDYNLWAIGVVTETFPQIERYLWLEIPYITMIRPVPRALWKTKPQGLSVSIEEYAGVGGLMTMACTFIGEGYMSLGHIGVLVFGLGFGMLARWWSSHLRAATSDLGIVFYASGLFAAGICMRSIQMLTTAILPTIAVSCLAVLLTKRQALIPDSGRCRQSAER